MSAPNKEPHNPEQQSQASMLHRREVLMDIYRHMLTVAYAKMKNEADALDIVQEAWLKILIKWDTLKDKDKLIQWAKTIVANTANSAIRRKVVYRELLREKADIIYVRLQDQDDEFHWEKQELQACILRLEEGTRRIFLLKFYYDWKDQDIADELDMPLGTVKARIHRGKKQLRGWLRASRE